MGFTPEYQDLLQRRYAQVIARTSNSQGSGPRAVRALALVLNKESSEASSLLESLNEESLNGHDLGRYLEASALTAAADPHQTAKAATLARKAIDSDPQSIFARRLLARLFEADREYTSALEQYRAVRELYPLSHRTALDEARLLFRLGQAKEARRLLKSTPATFRRALYSLAFVRRGPLGLASAFLILIPVTSVPVSAILAGVGGASVLVSIRESDPLMFSTGVWIEIVVGASWVLRLVLERLPAA